MVVAGAAVEVDGSSGVGAVACASGGQRDCGDGRVDRGEQDTPDFSERTIGVRGATDISPRRQYLCGCVWGRWGTRMSGLLRECRMCVDGRLPVAVVPTARRQRWPREPGSVEPKVGAPEEYSRDRCCHGR